jgi:Ser/Thr protein kinase RdoA (MazF antagonist)
MLSLADERLQQREKVIKLETLFDSNATANMLRRAWPDLEIQTALATYVRYKPLTSCLVRYDVTTAYGREMMYVNAYGSSATEKLGKALEVTQLETYCKTLEDENLVLHRFPDDSRLKKIRAFETIDERQLLLQKVLPAWREATFEVLTYKPQRRLATKVSRANDNAVLKFYTKSSFAGAKLKAKALATQSVVKHSKLLGRSSGFGVLAFAWQEGILLRAALLNPSFDINGMKNVGATLAALHAQKLELPLRLREKETRRVEELVAYLSWLQPALKPRLEKIHSYISTTLTDAPEHRVTLHGDFYSKQILLCDKDITFLDFDEACLGDAAFDLGLFIAHLEADAMRGFLFPSRLEGTRDSFLQGYEEAAKSLPSTLTLYTVIGMLSLLPHFFRNRHYDWPLLMDTFLTRIEHLVGRSETKVYAVSL